MRLTSVEPPGGPEYEEITIVLTGEKFFMYGEGQLVVKARPVHCAV